MKLWKGKKEESKPKPYLRFDAYLDPYIVDEDGRNITFLIDEMGKTEDALGRIERAGYSTSWAEWDKDGRFVRMLEEIEE